jgi:ATP-binding cassette subfamily B protein
VLRFLKYFARYWWQMILLLFGLAVSVWSSLELPTMMSQIVNQGIVVGDQDFIYRQSLLMLGAALIGGVGTVVSGFFAAQIGAGVALQIRHDVFSKVMSFSVFETNQFQTASLITRSTNDVNQVQMVSTMMLRMAFQAPLMGVGAIVKALETAAELAWIIALAVGALCVVIITLLIFVLPKFKIIQRLTDRLNLLARENLTGLRVVRAFNNEAREEKKFDQANQDLTKVNLFVNRVMVVMFPLVSLLLNIATLLVIWVGASYVESRAVGIGNLMAFMQYAIQVMMSFMFLSMIFIIMPRAMVSWRRINQVLKTNNSIVPPAKPVKPKTSHRGEVEFRNVSFSYPDADEPVLHDVSFKLERGQTVALIGSTGSGKSTVVNLIPRFYDVTLGAVLVDGVDVRNLSQKDLISRIGLVPQQGVLFSGTVASNIKYGAPKISQLDMKRAASVAQADFVKTLDGGFEAHIAQGGSNISGGQKQRLAIARAIAKNPEIYIFDDSFSALDYKTDAALRQALKPVTKQAAVLMVAQRISTIKHAERIIVLDKGRVVGEGKHTELMKTCKVYQEIARSQLSDDELSAELAQTKGGQR